MTFFGRTGGGYFMSREPGAGQTLLAGPVGLLSREVPTVHTISVRA